MWEDLPGIGWLRFVGSLKLYVSFAEYCLFHRALLQKRRKILRSLLTRIPGTYPGTPYEGTYPGTPYYTHKYTYICKNKYVYTYPGTPYVPGICAMTASRMCREAPSLRAPAYEYVWIYICVHVCVYICATTASRMCREAPSLPVPACECV